MVYGHYFYRIMYDLKKRLAYYIPSMWYCQQEPLWHGGIQNRKTKVFFSFSDEEQVKLRGNRTNA